MKRSRDRRGLWRYERLARAMGYACVAGVDEVGMGPLAGPVVAGAVVLPIGARLPGIDDSKRLSAMQRDRLDKAIRHQATAVATYAVGHELVDKLGLMQARHLACQGAVEALGVSADYLLCDAWDVPGVALPQMAVIRGDSTVASIMAASIVAKVVRDHLMTEYDESYPGWGFAAHKGYATAVHRAALMEKGPSPIHRMSWAPLRALGQDGQMALAAGPEDGTMASHG